MSKNTGAQFSGRYGVFEILAVLAVITLYVLLGVGIDQTFGGCAR